MVGNDNNAEQKKLLGLNEGDTYYRCSSCGIYWKNGARYHCPRCNRYLVSEVTLARAREHNMTFIDWEHPDQTK